jgi:tRNA1(Val) A37 N6-methylase TrmN6
VPEAITEDHLLDGRVHLGQPAEGYRVAIDPVMLAAAVPAKTGERVFDAGSGTGAASLCLAWRVPGCRVVGLERQRSLQRIARGNVERNGFEARVETIAGDLGRLPPRLAGTTFDHVMSNPPHHAAGTANRSPRQQRALAHVEEGLDLSGWLTACLRLLRAEGWLTLIHRAERLDQVLGILHGQVGGLAVFPLWPGPANRAAKRVLIQGRKGSRAPLRLLRGLTLHDDDGRYSQAAEDVLRRGVPLHLRDGDGP